MRVKHLELVNFRIFEHLNLPFTQLRTLLLGPNGSGKSTVVDAIQLMLTGHCRGTDLGGKGARKLINDNAVSAKLTMTTDWGVIIREITPEGSTTSHSPAVIAGRLNATPAMLDALLQGKAFFQQSHADAKDTLYRLVNVIVQPDDLPGCGIKDPIGIDTINGLYDAAYKQRPVLKKQLAAVQLPDLPTVVPMGTITEASADYDRAVQSNREWVGMVSKLEERERQLANQINALAARLVNEDQVKGALDTHRSMLAAAVADVNSHATALAEHDQDPTPRVDVPAAGGLAKQREGLIVKLRSHSPDRGCVLDDKIPCHTEVKHFLDKIAGLEAENERLEASIKSTVAWQSRRTELATLKSKAEQTVTYHRNQVEKLEGSLAGQAGIKDEIAKLKADKDEIPAVLAPARDKADQAAAEMKAAQDRLTAHRAYAAAVEARNRAAAARKTVEDQLTEAEARCKLLGPKGVAMKALAGKLGAFTDEINHALGRFGFSLEFQIDPWDVLIRREGRPKPISFDMLSKGEQLWTGAAFQLALAKMSGVGLCAIDDVESVVNAEEWNNARRVLTGIVMQSEAEQVIVAMAKGDHDPLCPKWAGGSCTCGTEPQVDGLQVVQMNGNTALVLAGQ